MSADDTYRFGKIPLRPAAAPMGPPSGRPLSTDEMLGQLLAGHARIEKRLTALEATSTTLTAVEQKRAGASAVVRWAGGIMVTIALGLGSAALSLAQTASTDHVILGNVVSAHRDHLADVAERERSRDEREDRLVNALSEASAAQRETKVALETLAERVSRLERATDSRRGR